jgi:ubiquinone/menaquinone biosynthesis C-methylase UbiE
LYDQYILPCILDLAMRNKEITPFRERVIARAEGRVLEVGAGSGLNLPLYTSRATEVIALEPHPKLLSMLRKHTGSIPVRRLQASAESIPLKTASVDTVVTTWTLCSIPDVATALREMRRVLKPGGRLLFVEHGLAPEAAVRKWQHRLTPCWKCIAGGCHLDRPIAELIDTAGFKRDATNTLYIAGPKPLTFMYEGSAITSDALLSDGM